MAHIWVIEILQDGKWISTTGVAMTRREAQQVEIPWWREGNPDDKYRVRKYLREEK